MSDLVAILDARRADFSRARSDARYVGRIRGAKRAKLNEDRVALVEGLRRHGRSRSQAVERQRPDRFKTEPSRYRHWKLSVEGDVATLTMDVDENAPLFEGYQLELNSYDLGVDIELADALERLEVRASAGARRAALRQAAGVLRRRQHPHAGRRQAVHKVDFCKFTNETRNAIEDMSEFSGLRTICVVTALRRRQLAGLALAADRRPGGRTLRRPCRCRNCRCSRCCRHRQAHPRHRQAQGAARSCRRVLHHRGGRQGRARGRMEAGGRGGAELEARRRRGGVRQRLCREVRPSGRCQGCWRLAPLEVRKTFGGRETGHVSVEIAGRIAAVTLRVRCAAAHRCASDVGARLRRSGRSRSPANSTTPSSTSASTSSTSRRSCSIGGRPGSGACLRRFP